MVAHLPHVRHEVPYSGSTFVMQFSQWYEKMESRCVSSRQMTHKGSLWGFFPHFIFLTLELLDCKKIYIWLLSIKCAIKFYSGAILEQGTIEQNSTKLWTLQKGKMNGAEAEACVVKLLCIWNNLHPYISHALTAAVICFASSSLRSNSLHTHTHTQHQYVWWVSQHNIHSLYFYCDMSSHPVLPLEYFSCVHFASVLSRNLLIIITHLLALFSFPI